MVRLLDPLQARDRILFGSTTGALLVIYALWRWHDTLPAFAFSVQNSMAVFLLCVRSARYLLHVDVNRHTLSPASTGPDRPTRRKTGWRREGGFPAVDVFICTYDEPLEILETSILTALALDYPNFTVWVLDDTRREWLREYCEAVARAISPVTTTGTPRREISTMVLRSRQRRPTPRLYWCWMRILLPATIS